MRARDSYGKIEGREARSVLVFIYFEYQRKWCHALRKMRCCNCSPVWLMSIKRDFFGKYMKRCGKLVLTALTNKMAFGLNIAV